MFQVIKKISFGPMFLLEQKSFFEMTCNQLRMRLMTRPLKSRIRIKAIGRPWTMLRTLQRERRRVVSKAEIQLWNSTKSGSPCFCVPTMHSWNKKDLAFDRLRYIPNQSRVSKFLAAKHGNDSLPISAVWRRPVNCGQGLPVVRMYMGRIMESG